MYTRAGVNVDKIDDAVQAILEEYARVKTELIPADELKRQRIFCWQAHFGHGRF